MLTRTQRVNVRGRLPLEGERALITGGARGIGLGIAEQLARRGAEVVLADLPSAELGLARASDEFTRRGQVAAYVTMDVADLGSVERALAVVRTEHGPIDILVNNAGIAHVGLFADQDPNSIARLVAVNLTGAMMITRLMLPGMLERNHGRIMFVASIQGIAGTPGFVTYSATKGGMIRFAEALQREVVNHAISVTTVLPPAVETQAFREAKEQAPNLLKWAFFPPVPVEQVARRAVRGLVLGESRVYAGKQSALAAIANRVSQGLMGFVLVRSFREEGA
jgi:short-subunit dehydrogenase